MIRSSGEQVELKSKACMDMVPTQHMFADSGADLEEFEIEVDFHV